jgi:hypothetical protein
MKICDLGNAVTSTRVKIVKATSSYQMKICEVAIWWSGEITGALMVIVNSLLGYSRHNH